VTEAVPTEAIRLAGTAALNCVADTNVVLNAEPLHRTVSPLTKLIPVIVSVNAAPPATDVGGEMEVIDGVGVIMLKLREADVAPPGACTLTEAMPVEVIRLAGTAALS